MTGKYMKKALIFPGQGSQAVGMGKDFYEAFAAAKEVYQEVDDALNQKLSKVIFEGPESELVLTENAQPAIMATSLAILRVLEKEVGFKVSEAAYVAGHSLGEYAALCAAGTFTLSDTARLLKIRGQAMQQAVPVGQGAMAAVLGLEIADIEAIVKEAGANGDPVGVANDNSPGQIVISGSVDGVEKASELCKAKGAKRVVPLAVSAPFHSEMMQPAAKVMAEALGRVNMNRPIVPVIANVTAEPVSDPAQIRALLVEQVAGRVRWRESVMKMKQLGVTQTIEIGVGKVLTGLSKRIEKEIDAIAIASPQDVDVFAKAA